MRYSLDDDLLFDQVLRMGLAAAVAIVIALLIIGVVDEVWAQVVPAPAGLWKGVIGEAVGEGYDGMYAVACCYKNRIEAGLPLGCVAMRRADLDAFVRRQGPEAERAAKQIIDQVFSGSGQDVTRAATHYENVEKYGMPPWARGMEKTVKIGAHTFFKDGR